MRGLLAALLADVSDLQTQGNIAPYAILFAFGFLVGIGGHLSRSPELVLAGIVIAGVAAALPWLLWS